MKRHNRISLRDYKLAYRSSPILLKCAAIVAVLAGTVSLLSLRASLQGKQQKMADLRLQAIQLEQDNAAVQRDIDQLGTVAGMKKIASSQLGMADPDTTLFCPAE